ncbi:MAG: hypothetical protein K6T92_04100, partial [Candidatus Rokubacteria bacterium]|nr:hypothetical protein [Candidatus Rokubacteria bacterium]
PVLAAWAADPSPPPAYEAGTWGPAEAEGFIARDRFSWLNP